MDVLSPPLIHIGNRCYRRNPIAQNDTDLSEEPMKLDCVWDDEISCEDDADIEKTDTGYRLELNIPSVLFKHLIGVQGATKKRLESETRTQIQIPKPGRSGPVVVQGHDRGGIVSAKTRISVIVDSARQREPFTHFLSLPIVGEEIRNNFVEFKYDLLRECNGDRGLDETIFQNPFKLHLTVGTLVLLCPEEIDRATDMLNRYRDEFLPEVVEGRPLQAYIRDLDYMNDDPGEVDVLYAKLTLQDGSDRLQRLADDLVDKFSRTGLMQKDFNKVKLHITIMNTLMRKDPDGATSIGKQGRKDKFKERETFDATNVLRNFADFDFGSYHIDSIHLSQHRSKGEDGYYKHASSINI